MIANELSIARAKSEDLAELLALMQKQFSEHAIDVEAAQLETAIGRLIGSEALGFVLTARKDGYLVGLAAVSFAWTLEHGGRSAWLDELYVLPAFRGLGAGTALLDQVILEAKKDGCLAIDLEVDSVHRRAEHLYQRYGFRPLDRRRWVMSLG